MNLPLRKKNLPYVCPTCESDLELASDGMILRCPEHGSFSLTHGFWSFCSSSESFDNHWEQNQLAVAPAKSLSARSFLEPLLSCAAREKRPWRILDAGCGDGVHLAELARLLPQSADVIGVDLSMRALAAAASRCRPGWTLAHADVLSLPFSSGYFDAVFSYGVIAYCSDPKAALHELARVARPGGFIGIWAFTRREDLLGRAFDRVRALVPKLPPALQARIADLIVPFLAFLPTSSGLHLGNASWRQCREIVLVNIAPPVLHFPSQSELRSMVEGTGLHIFHEDTRNPLAIWARNP